MTRVDLKRSLDSYRARPGEFRVLDAPPLRYLMVDGSWTVLLLVPDWLGADAVEAAREGAAAKRALPAADLLRFDTLEEGRCVQTLHVGSYDDEAEVLARLHDEFIPEAGLRMTGRHHEIYLSDPRKVAPATLRTILRQPVTAA